MEMKMLDEKCEKMQEITEGLAKIETCGKVFYNPVQEFNRDLSISVLTTFAKQFNQESQIGIKCEHGITILEALSATGLRSIRYAKEIPGIKEVIANDISQKAVDNIKHNISLNGVESLVTSSHDNAVMLMLRESKNKIFDAIDLDPYGCPSIFLDSAVQAIKDGGLLLVTATDMAVLAGNSPETCYSKYGAISLRMKSCHEMAIRILLQCIESHANRHARYILPLLSVSADFYIRVFVRVFSGAKKCKETTTKLSNVYHCTGCGSFTLHPLGKMKINEKNQSIKYALATGPPVGHKCEHCEHPHHIGGPVWSSHIHSLDFVKSVLRNLAEHLNTVKRIQGILTMISEELLDVPLYYTLEMLSGTIHVETPPMMILRSAILNAGYKVSYSHMNKTSIKTNAPTKFMWDIMRCWAVEHPVNKKRLVDSNNPATNILSKNIETKCSFQLHSDANPESRKLGFLRYQQNPAPHWGPGTRATAMVGDKKIEKSKLNQGKRKRDSTEEDK